MKILRITTLLFLTGLAAAPLLRADEVVLRDGTHLKGTITIEAGRVIVSQSDASKIIFPSNQIVSLHKSLPPPAAPLLHADEVVLRDGTHLKGTITIEAGRVIISQSDGSKIIFPSNQIVSLHPDPAPAATSAPGPATATSAEAPR